MGKKLHSLLVREFSKLEVSRLECLWQVSNLENLGHQKLSSSFWSSYLRCVLGLISSLYSFSEKHPKHQLKSFFNARVF